jgi:hypothetical protein
VEINPRVAGTIMLPVKAGVDLLELLILKSIGMNEIPNYSLIEGVTITRELVDIYTFENEKLAEI